MLSCFKAYDIRGQLGEELNPDIAYRIGRALAQYLNAKSIVVGADVRHSSEPLKKALSDGICQAGCNVIDIGMSGTEEIYFATQHLGVDGGVEVTASHNPIDFNGMKLVRENAKPISGDSGLKEIQQIAESQDFRPSSILGKVSHQSILSAYIEHMLSYVDTFKLKPLKLVVNAGNGAAGHVIDQIEQYFQQQQIPIQFFKIHHEANADFPHGIPNPLLVENRADTANAVIKHQADMGIAWDGDFDRCFLFDEKGQFIEGYYIVGLLAEVFLAQHPGAKIIHDPRLIWNTQSIVNKYGGTAILCKTGHAFIKERMRAENAVYGGEMSAHHYFRDFAYCDSGMIPWLLIAQLLSVKNRCLSALVASMIEQYPSSGEINQRLKHPSKAIDNLLNHFKAEALAIDYTDGISVEFEQWRFSLRQSNTEPVVRLNVETKHDVDLLQRKTQAILALLK